MAGSLPAWPSVVPGTGRKASALRLPWSRGASWSFDRLGRVPVLLALLDSG